MKSFDKIMRAIAFYFSVALFIILLPILLSYSLGYKIDYKNLKIYNTGIVYLNTNPAGASIYINDKLYKDLTPVQIEAMKPGTYKIEIRREGYYPWQRELVVRPNMVTKADRIILFPLARDIKTKQMYVRGVSDFILYNKNYIYYLTSTGLYRSNMDGTLPRRLCEYSDWPKKIIGKKFSPDGSRMIFFDKHKIYAVYLNLKNEPSGPGGLARVEEVLSGTDPIIDVFWYSVPDYIIVVTEIDIKVVELRGGAARSVISLYTFGAAPQTVYYDQDSDSLYFVDAVEREGKKIGEHLYRLDLREKFFDTFMHMLLLRKETENE